MACDVCGEGKGEGTCEYCQNLYSDIVNQIEEEERLSSIRIKRGSFVDPYDREKERDAKDAKSTNKLNISSTKCPKG